MKMSVAARPKGTSDAAEPVKGREGGSGVKAREPEEDCEWSEDSEPLVPRPERGEEEGAGVEDLTVDALRRLEGEAA